MELGPGNPQPLPKIMVYLGLHDKKFQVILLKCKGLKRVCYLLLPFKGLSAVEILSERVKETQDQTSRC